jgi:ABC-type multidrug transport system ATPase subunit
MDGDVRVKLSNVSVARGRTEVLLDVDLELGAGVTVLLGPNGAGKTTLLSALVGLLPVKHGRIEFLSDGGEPVPGADVRRSLGFVPQEGTLPRGAALADVVAYAAWLQRVPAGRREAAVAEALDAMRLTDRARSPVNRLSGGMRRRGLLACAIVHKPALLICDEPAVGLDPAEQHAFRALVREQGEHRTVLLSTHILDEAAEVADTLVVLAEGRIRFAGQAGELIQSGDEPAPVERTRALEEAYMRLAGAGEGW